MTKISNQIAYIPDEEINGLDYLPGTDVDSGLKTVNFRVKDLGTHYNQANGVRNFDYNFYEHLEPTATPKDGCFYSNENNQNPEDITHFIFSKKTASNKNIFQFFESIAIDNPFDLVISQKIGINTIFFFKITSIETFSSYYKINIIKTFYPPNNILEFTISNTVFNLKAEGIFIHNQLGGLNDGDYVHLTAEEKDKFDNLPDSFPNIPTKTSDLTNDGEDGTNPFITAEDLPSPVDLSGLVPYEGATQDVDLGENQLDAKSVKINGVNGDGHLGLRHQSSNPTAGGQETVLFAGNDGELYYKNDGNSVEKIAKDSAKQNNLNATNLATINNALTTDDAITDASVFNYTKGASQVKTTWLNLKAVLKTYFDAIYTTSSSVASQISSAISNKLDKVTSSGAERVYIINADGSQGTKPTSDFSSGISLLRQEFTFSGSQTFTLSNNYAQVYSVEVQGQGALSTSQYALVSPNQITINDTLDSGDYIVVIYSNGAVGVQPYYTQAEVTALFKTLSGSGNYVDTQYTSASPFTITSGTTASMPCNGGIKNETQTPIGYLPMFNTATGRLQAYNIEDSFIVNIRFKAKTSVNNDFFNIRINIGGTIGNLTGKTLTFQKGANTEQEFNEVLYYFTRTTFIANGGQIRITASSGNLQIYDIQINPVLIHKAL